MKRVLDPIDTLVQIPFLLEFLQNLPNPQIQKMSSCGVEKLKQLLSLTGHNYSAHQGTYRRNIHLAIISVILALGFYQSVWFLYNNVLRCGVNLFMLRFMIWTSKGILVQLFLLHLQFSGQLDRLIALFSHAKNDPGKKTNWFLAISVAIYLLLMLGGLVYFVLRMRKVVDVNYHFKYGNFEEIFIRNLLWWVTCWIVVSTLVFYNHCVLLSIGEVQAFCKQIQFSASERQAGFPCPISKLFQRYICLMKQVECLNDTFKVYLFFMLGLNIPVTISTLLRLLKSPFTGSLQYLFILPENLFCWFELIALTAMAAKLNILLRRIPKAFSVHVQMEGMLEKGKDQLEPIRMLFFHFASNQPGLGLTLWEFATITKPLIMTVVSLVATYLTVIIQVIPAEGEQSQQPSGSGIQQNNTILC